MEKWGVTKKGFYRPTLEDIISEKNKKAKELLGENFNTDEKTWAGKLFRINAAAESKLCEIAENVYYSIFPSTARGISLDRVCEFVNLNRESEGFAAHVIRVYGTQDYIIQAGTLFKNDKGIEFYALEETGINGVEILEDNTTLYYADVTVKCTQSGTSGNVTDINATTEVDTNIDDVVWIKSVAEGTKTENDPDLREKFSNVINGLGTNTEASIIANVLRIAGVNDVMIIDNNTADDIVVSDNLTVVSGSYAVIVHSDNTTYDDYIAEAIREKQPFGIMQSGTKSVEVKDNAGVIHTVKFTYVENKTINVAVSIQTDNTFPTDGIEQIEDNITAYINGLGIGEEVIHSRLYDYIYNVTGVYKVTEITLNGEKSDIAVSKIKTAKVGTIEVKEG